MAARVLYVSDGKLGPTGIDLVTREQLLALSETGHEVDLLARGSIALPGVSYLGQRLPPTKLFSWLSARYYYGLNKRYFSWLGARRVRQSEYGIACAWSKSALLTFKAARAHGVRCILNVGNYHCDHPAGGKASGGNWPAIGLDRLRAEYELADRILVASDYAAATFLERGVPPEKVRVIYRGVDTDRFQPKPGRENGPFVVAMCGRITERKGAHLLLQVWQQLALANAELWLIGTVDEHERRRLEATADKNVRFLGFRSDLPDLLRMAHVHVLLSRNEGLAKALLEAEASGVVNVCTREAGLPSDDSCRFVVSDREDLARIAGVLAELHGDRKRCLALGDAARRKVVLEFGWQAFRRRFIDAIAA